MKRKGYLKRTMAYVLSICMLVLGLAVTDYSVVRAADGTDTQTTRVWFYNNNFDTVNAYVWGASTDDPLGGYPGTAATQDGSGKWYYVDVPCAEAFNIIFNDGSDQVAAYIQNGNVYVTATDTTFATKEAAEENLGIGSGEGGSGEGGSGDGSGGAVKVYFYNTSKWETVNAYVWGASTEDPLGGWPGAAAAPSAVGENWVEVSVPAELDFHVIFFNAADDTERVDIQFTDADKIYGTMTGSAYPSKETAVEALNATPTTLYFLNNDGWEKVYAHAYADDAPIGSVSWPGREAEEAAELGEGWWKVSIPQNGAQNPFAVIFNDGAGNQIADIDITNYENNYITGEGKLYTTQIAAETSVGILSETVVYFLNSKDWANVGAYVYGVGEALGPWPGTMPEQAGELGEKWLKVAVPAKPAFNIIFFNKDADAERAELQIPSESRVYVTGSNEVYGSAEEAELSEGLGDPSKTTTIYFYNSRGWGDINGYIFTGEGDNAVTFGKGWPGSAAALAPEIGENWWKLTVPKEATAETPFSVIFNDGMNQTKEGVLISDKVNVYVIAAEAAYSSAAEAEAAAANDGYDDGCEKGENTDLGSYVVSYTGAGAALTYTTYEAEAADTNARVLGKNITYREAVQSEASGRQAVKLEQTGEYVEFTLKEPANAMVLRYSMPDSADGTGIEESLSLYINGNEAKDLELTSKYAWVYGGYPYNNNPANGLPHRYFDELRMMFDEKLPAGTKLRLQKDAGDTAENYVIDFIECELVEDALTQPENSLSVTDFGAVANDGADDYAAFAACIEAAREQGKEVWIPAGTFHLEEKKALTVNAVTIRGAGMWYTNLEGAGAAFKYQGTSKFYDFAMTGVSTVRDDGGDLAGFEGNGSRATNVTIQNVWMEHMKVGVWSCNTENLVIQGCRIRNTYADGINLCSGTNNAVVRNNSLRNTGDDGIAIWPWLSDCSGNTITHNTLQVPTLANGVAIYGGADNVVDSNYVADIINNGAGICVGSEFTTKEGYKGTITVKNNVLDRCGSMQTDENYPIGAIWIWSSYNPMTTTYKVYGNQLHDCSYEGILLECSSDLTGVNLQHNNINGATDGVYVYGNGNGSGKVGNMTAENLTGKLINNSDANFVLTEVDEDIADEEEPHTHTGGKATCTTKAKCSVCGEYYGSVDKNNHTGGTEVKGKVEATAARDGYTGDTYCKGCGAKLKTGTTIPKTGNTDSGNSGDTGNDDNGKTPKQNGWYEKDGAKYWYEEGVKQGTEGRGKEIYDPGSDAWYWLDAPDGVMAVSKDVYQESEAGNWGDRLGDDGVRYGKWVRYDENGHMVKGWQDTDAGTYYFDEIYGTMAKGYATIDRKEYYFNPWTGVLEQTIGEVPEYGWKNIDGKDYWYENSIRQGYSIDESYRGKEIYDPDTDAWYWLANVQGGAKAVSKDVYQESLAGDWGDYTGADGERYGKWVRYDENGHMVKGWQTTDAGTYFFDYTYGTMAKGNATIEGADYYFNVTTGIME